MRETLFMKCTNTAHFDDGEEVIANVFIHAVKYAEKLCNTVALSFMTWIFERFCYIAIPTVTTENAAIPMAMSPSAECRSFM